MTTLLASFVAIGSILLGPSTAVAAPGDAPSGAAAWADALWTAALADDRAKVEELLKAAPADDAPAMQKVRERVAERARNHETREAERKADLEKHEKEMGEHVTKGELLKALVDGANIRYLLSEAEWKQRGTTPAFRDLVKTALAEAAKAESAGDLLYAQELTFRATREYTIHDPTRKGEQWKRSIAPSTMTDVSLFIDSASDRPKTPVHVNSRRIDTTG